MSAFVTPNIGNCLRGHGRQARTYVVPSHIVQNCRFDLLANTPMLSKMYRSSELREFFFIKFHMSICSVMRICAPGKDWMSDCPCPSHLSEEYDANGCRQLLGKAVAKCAVICHVLNAGPPASGFRTLQQIRFRDRASLPPSLRRICPFQFEKVLSIFRFPPWNNMTNRYIAVL